MFDKKEYMRKYMSQRREEDGEKYLGYDRKWRKRNPEYMKEYNKKYYERNREKYSEYAKKKWKENPEYYEKNREKREECFREWYKKNREKWKGYVKKYNQTEKGKASRQREDAKRRVRESEIINTLTSEEWLNILKEYGYKCAYCGKEFDLFDLPERDHIIPVSKGGSNTKENIVPACRHCNSSKGNKSVNIYYKKLN